MIYTVIPELLRFVPRFMGTRACTNLAFHCLLTSEADVKGILSRFRETFWGKLLITILSGAGRVVVHF